MPPKISMYKKKKVTAAEAVVLFVSATLSKAAKNIMHKDNPAQPQIIVHLRPMRSRASAGRRLPMGNILNEVSGSVTLECSKMDIGLQLDETRNQQRLSASQANESTQRRWQVVDH